MEFQAVPVRIPKLPVRIEMVLSRAQGKAAFDHVLDNVLGRDDTSPLKKALIGAGVQDMFALNTLDNDTIDSLVYNVSTTEKDVSINRGDKSLVWVLLGIRHSSC